MLVTDKSKFKYTAASVLVKTGKGRIRGIFVSTASGSPTIKLWDSLTATGTIVVNTFIPVAATFYEFPEVGFDTGLYITIANTVTCTVEYN